MIDDTLTVFRVVNTNGVVLLNGELFSSLDKAYGTATDILREPFRIEELRLGQGGRAGRGIVARRVVYSDWVHGI